MPQQKNRHQPSPRRQSRPSQHLGHAFIAQLARRNRLVSIAPKLALALVLSLTSCIGLAGETRVGDYLIRYNALHSENLTSDIAKRVGIAQNAKNIVVIVNVQKPGAGSVPNTVAAKVSGSARDLFSNKKSLTFKQVKEAGAIDYMAQTQIKNEETLIFDLIVTPDGGPTKKLQFQQKFYVSSD